ncbi:type II CAAX prenyl endopeptidase Rce1 family protein [Amycolatopsis sp. NPDC059657]|uniref:CPBP family glutamic-type intramembrane protease n=1 Tax=Amycolatopsis sp. NPDC059657 TaxID=3346899 RepID=UPI00366F55C2
MKRGFLAGVTVTGAALLGKSLASEPGSPRFYGLTGAVAAAWLAGASAAGPVPRGRREVVPPALTGASAFAVFYAVALVARRIPPLRRAIAGVLTYAHRGSTASVVLTTLANGAAEEVFFRGAVYSAAGPHPVRTSTALYVLTTMATRNPALVLASAVMGTLFGVQRQRSGGVQAPLVTHVVWSALMLAFLPRLFPRDEPGRK